MFSKGTFSPLSMIISLKEFTKYPLSLFNDGIVVLLTWIIPMELRGQALLIHADGAFRGDLSWTSAAIGNIVKNCMEHTPEGGRIEIEATENALFSEIIIKDNGTGISPEDLPHIFERFYKGKDSDGKSFGIGLALSRMIIAGQGGTVKAENRKPVGAMFTIRFYKGTV